jgi:hypothetical protein
VTAVDIIIIIIITRTIITHGRQQTVLCWMQLYGCDYVPMYVHLQETAATAILKTVSGCMCFVVAAGPGVPQPDGRASNTGPAGEQQQAH